MFRATAFVALLAALCLASCRRSVSAAKDPAGAVKQPPAAAASGIAPTAANAALPTPSPAAESGTPMAAPRQAAAVPAPAAPASAAGAGLFGLLGQGAQDGTLPEDFAIGPLGAARLLADDEQRAAFAAAETLLDAFVRGRVERAGIAAEPREALAGMISFALEQGDQPAAWRLGPPRAHGAELVANLRLLGTDGSAEGEIYARREGGGILVSDLQIDPARMRVRRDRPDRTFFPSPYRWLLGG